MLQKSYDLLKKHPFIFYVPIEAIMLICVIMLDYLIGKSFQYGYIPILAFLFYFLIRIIGYFPPPLNLLVFCFMAVSIILLILAPGFIAYKLFLDFLEYRLTEKQKE